ncbi:MAG: Ig-like domain-containing protein [Roseovarius sp.]
MTTKINPPMNGRPVSINAARADVSAYHKAGPDLILVFDDGRSIIITDYYLRPQHDGSRAIEFSDGAYPATGAHTGDDSFANSLALTATGLVATGALTAIVSEGRSTPDRQANRPPVAEDDEAEADFGETIYIDVLANDSDPDGDELTITSLTLPPDRAAIVTTEDGQQLIQYMARDGIRDDLYDIILFHYTVSDGNGGTTTAMVSVAIDPWQPGDPPVYPFLNHNPDAAPDDQPQETGTMAIMAETGAVLSAGATSAGSETLLSESLLQSLIPAGEQPGETTGKGGFFAPDTADDAGAPPPMGHAMPEIAFHADPGVAPLWDADPFLAEPVM